MDMTILGIALGIALIVGALLWLGFPLAVNCGIASPPALPCAGGRAGGTVAPPALAGAFLSLWALRLL